MGFDLQPTEEQSALVETLRDFSNEVLRPAARDCERAGETSAEIARQVHEIGVTAPVDEEYGGGGTFDAITYVMAAEELAWGDPGIAAYVLGTGLPAIVIGLAGNDEQKERFLPSFADAAPAKAFVAVAEKIAAGDLGSLETVVDSDKVVGRKYGVLDANDAAFGVAIGRSGSELGAAIVEPDAWRVVRNEDKLGLKAAPSAVIDLDGAGSGLSSGPELDKAILWTKLATGAIAVGQGRASLEYAAEYAKERQAFGRPIGAFQAISFKIADMAIAVDSGRAALWKAAWLLDRGEASPSDVTAAVGQCLEAAILCGDDGVQVLGGHGYITDHPVEKWFRDGVTLSVLDSPELLGDALVGRAVLAGGAS